MYRLIEDLPGIGIAGEIISAEKRRTVPHYNLPLTERINQRDGSTEMKFPFVFIKDRGAKSHTYAFDTMTEVTDFLNKQLEFENFARLGFMTAAMERRNYKFSQNKTIMRLAVNEDLLRHD